MDELVLHERTKRHITALLKEPPHAIILHGPEGSGKTTLARAIAAEILGLSLPALANYPYVRQFAPENGVLSVEQARAITGFLRLRTTGDRQLRRVIIIEHAGAMTLEAQNTILKTLEEPPVDTVIILTVNDIQTLLPTVLSRAQRVDVQVPLEAQVKERFLTKGFNSTKITQAYAMSGGLPGLMEALLENDDSHPLVAAVEQAKQLLGATAFERLAQIDGIIKQKQQQAVVWAMIRIAQAAIAGAAGRPSGDAAIKRWSAVLEAALTADRQLAGSAQAKLVMTNLFLAV